MVKVLGKILKTFNADYAMKNPSVFIDTGCSKTCEKICTKNQIVGCQNPKGQMPIIIGKYWKCGNLSSQKPGMWILHLGNAPVHDALS